MPYDPLIIVVATLGLHGLLRGAWRLGGRLAAIPSLRGQADTVTPHAATSNTDEPGQSQ